MASAKVSHIVDTTGKHLEIKPPVRPAESTKAKGGIRRRVGINAGAGTRSEVWVTVDHKGIDPKQKLLDAIGPIDPNMVQFSRILVAIYQPPIVNQTEGGILLTDKITEEDMREYLWQGKVGLIVAMGPQAYVDDESTKFHGTKNKVGDWVWFRPNDCMACEVNSVFCRIAYEKDIIGRLPHPDSIW